MKKILTLLAITLAVLTSCKEELVQYSISVDPVELSFNSAGGEDTVYVTSSAEWELFSDSGWCHASSTGGNSDMEIVVTVEPNEDSKSGRTATFTFVSGDKKATLTVTQEKKEYSISIEPKELVFNADGGEQEIIVTSSDEWEVTGEFDWCDVSGIDGDTVKFSVEPYTNTEARTATFTFVCGDKEAVLNIQQDAKEYSISVEPTELTFIAAGEEKPVTVTSSDAWTFSSDESWISASEKNGENGAVVNIVVEENEDTEVRTGTAIFRCGDKRAEVQITQEPKEFSISIEPAEIEFEAEGGEQTITVTSSDSWRLTTDSDWITTSAKSGENGSTVNVIVGYTISDEIRTGTITFTCGDKTAEVTVAQNPDSSPIIQFKDPYFLEALLDEGATEPVIDKNGDGQISENEAKSITELSLSDSRYPVRNVDELSFFSSLESITISGYGEIEEFDFSNRANLKSVRCPGGAFSSLNLSGCSALTEIKTYTEGSASSLTTLNISGCSSLESLRISYSHSGAYSVSTEYYEEIIADDCTSLKEIVCETKSLSVKNCTSLEILECENAYSLNLSDCKLLKILKIHGGRSHSIKRGTLKSLDLSNNTALEYLSCPSNELTSLDLSKNTALTYLDCSNNDLTSLDLSNCPALTHLDCASNELTSLDLSKNTALTYLDCMGNDLTSLDLSNHTALTFLGCFGNRDLTFLDLSGCTALTTLWCYDSQLTSIDLSGCTALTELGCSNNQLTSLDLYDNRLLKHLGCSKNLLQKLILYKYHILSDSSISKIEYEYGDIIEYME